MVCAFKVLLVTNLFKDSDTGSSQFRLVRDVCERGESGEEHVQLDSGHQSVAKTIARNVPLLSKHLKVHKVVQIFKSPF